MMTARLKGVIDSGTNNGTHTRNSLVQLEQHRTAWSGSAARINELARGVSRSAELGTHFRSAALPTDDPPPWKAEPELSPPAISGYVAKFRGTPIPTPPR